MRHGRHRPLFFRQKGIFNVFQLPLPTKDYLFTVGFFKPVFNTLDQDWTRKFLRAWRESLLKKHSIRFNHEA